MAYVYFEFFEDIFIGIAVLAFENIWVPYIIFSLFNIFALHCLSVFIYSILKKFKKQHRLPNDTLPQKNSSFINKKERKNN